jgi:transposase
MFKESLVGVLPSHIFMLLDSGYQGAADYFPNALLPYKTTKNNPLTAEQKAFNTMISKLRVVIEHINRQLKIFRICKETYRGKGESGLRRVKIVASLLNHMTLA